MSSSCTLTPITTVNYGYDAASGRLASVSSGGITATYRYNAATGWNEGVSYSSGLSSTRTADGMGRLDAITWSAGGSTLSGHDYTLDGMNRRTAAQRQDGSKWHYDYNPKGEVTDVSKKDASEMPEPWKQHGYEFDGIGNRTGSTVSSLADDETLRSTSYQADELNQYTQIQHPQPGWLVLRGSANAAASVTIDGLPPTVRTGPLWHYEKSVDNSGGAVRRIAEISATRPNGGLNNGPVTAKRKGAMFIPPPAETPTYDLDGNQTSDARWTYTWDAENRLITAEEGNIPVSVAVGVSPPSVTVRQKLEFSYDSQGRRLTKRVYEQRTENGAQGTFVLKESLVFLYDGWNMIAEIDITETTPRLLRSYEWGTDLSGTMEGAGGVGGLLVERFHSASTSTAGSNSQPPPSGAHAPLYDGNGNITELVNLSNGSVSARYEYGAFGETLSVEGGAVAEANPFRFSTKYEDAESGMLYYGFRYYSPELGRWVSRDPIGESGGVNLYGFVGNDGVNRVDVLGLRGLNVQEQQIVQTLEQVKQSALGADLGNSASSKAKRDAFVGAVDAVITDFKGAIAAMPDGFEGSPSYQTGRAALLKWSDPQARKWYAEHDKGRGSCNLFVANSLRDAGINYKVINRNGNMSYPASWEWFDPNRAELVNFEVVWRIQYGPLIENGVKKTTDDGKEIIVKLIDSGKRPPGFGDVTAFAHHVGIYIGQGLYVSASGGGGWGQSGFNEVVVKPVKAGTDVLYRGTVNESK